jgi:hypothetical protein
MTKQNTRIMNPIKIPLKRQFEKINRNRLRVNQSFIQGTGGIFKSGRNKLRFYCRKL